MARGGQSFGAPSNLGRGLGKAAKADRFDQGFARRSGIYPTKGKGWAQQGEGQYPDLLRKWNNDQNWTCWRRGMEIAYNDLVGDTSQFMAVDVLRLPAFNPDLGFQATRALLAGFPSRHSPEGRWTCAIKPRGSEISPLPITDECQSDLLFINRFEEEVPLLVVTLPGLFSGRRPGSGNPLIGELIEDTATDQGTVIDEADEALILMCVAVYEDEGLMAFDARTAWRRVRQPNGSSILKMIRLDPLKNPPRFRAGRHLTQSTTISCNCPSHLGVEYGKLLMGPALGSQALFPQVMVPSADVVVPLQDAMDRAFRVAPEQRLIDPLEGVARRFFLMGWQRWPNASCKHVHAVRFALGCPTEEPADMPAVIGDYWSAISALQPWEMMSAPLASPQFKEALEKRTLNDQAFEGLGSTITTGAVGDCWSVTVEKTGLAGVQVDAATRIAAERVAGGEPRLCQQWVTPNGAGNQDAICGDVWAGRLTQRWSFPYESPGVLIDQPFFLPQRGAPTVLP